jgi:hypothetical protein
LVSTVDSTASSLIIDDVGGTSIAQKKVKSIFFTLHFYRFPLLTSERLLLHDPPNEEDSFAPRILLRMDEQGLPTGQKGLLLRFYGDGPTFVHYLANKFLLIDVWDGESLLLIGK